MIEKFFKQLFYKHNYTDKFWITSWGQKIYWNEIYCIKCDKAKKVKEYKKFKSINGYVK